MFPKAQEQDTGWPALRPSRHEKMQLLTQIAVYWPRLDNDIAGYIKRCSLCMKHKATQPVQPMLHNNIREGPWQNITANYFTHQNKEYLLICDTFCKYPFTFRVTSKTAQFLTQKLHNLLSQYGLQSIYSSTTDPLLI